MNLNGPTTMDVVLIWGRAPEDKAQEYWVINAWDEDSVDANRQGFEAEVAEEVKERGANNVRVTKVTINFDAVQAAFNPMDVTLPQSGMFPNVLRGQGGGQVLINADQYRDEMGS